MKPSANDGKLRRRLTPWWVFIFSIMSLVGVLAGSVGLAVSFREALKGSNIPAAVVDSSLAESSISQVSEGPYDFRGLRKAGDPHFYPVAVMIDNLEPARPQAGLQQASIVYEALVEGSATRFLAIIERDHFERIGPVRSARPYFLAWASEFNALYVHAGGSPEALQDIQKLDLHDVNALLKGSRYFQRVSDRRAPHNLYTTDTLLSFAIRDGGLEGQTAPEPWWTYDWKRPSGEPASSLRIEFASNESRLASYAYDSVSGAYIRSTAGKPHLDAQTGQPIAVQNIIVLTIPRIVAVGEKGRLTLDITGTGSMSLVRDGVILRGIWQKAGKESKTQFTSESGSPLALKPGNIWIEVVPEDRPVHYE